MIFVSHMTLQDHVIEVSCNFMSWSFSFFVTAMSSSVSVGIVAVEILWVYYHMILQGLETRSKTLPSLVAIGFLLVDIMVFDYHLPLQDHMIRGSCDFMERR